MPEGSAARLLLRVWEEWLWKTLGGEIYNLAMVDLWNLRESSVSRTSSCFVVWITDRLVVLFLREHWKVWDNTGKGGMTEESNFKFGHGNSEVTLRFPKEHIK